MHIVFKTKETEYVSVASVAETHRRVIIKFPLEVEGSEEEIAFTLDKEVRELVLERELGNMVFREDRETTCCYKSPYGDIFLELKTLELEFGLGYLRVGYQLLQNGEEVSREEISLKYREEGE